MEWDRKRITKNMIHYDSFPFQFCRFFVLCCRCDRFATPYEKQKAPQIFQTTFLSLTWKSCPLFTSAAYGNALLSSTAEPRCNDAKCTHFAIVSPSCPSSNRSILDKKLESNDNCFLPSKPGKHPPPNFPTISTIMLVFVTVNCWEKNSLDEK